MFTYLRQLNKVATFVNNTKLLSNTVIVIFGIPINFILVLMFNLFMLPSILYADDILDSEYKTKEFSDPNSRIPTLLLCTFAGQTTGLGTDAVGLAADFLLDVGNTKEQIELWMHDTEIYSKTEMSGLDLRSYWKEMCEEPFSKMREVFGAQ